jgi:hypothetical protein
MRGGRATARTVTAQYAFGVTPDPCRNRHGIGRRNAPPGIHALPRSTSYV